MGDLRAALKDTAGRESFDSVREQKPKKCRIVVRGGTLISHPISSQGKSRWYSSKNVRILDLPRHNIAHCQAASSSVVRLRFVIAIDKGGDGKVHILYLHRVGTFNFWAGIILNCGIDIKKLQIVRTL